ncbi:hypothetical protein Pcinc_020792 [Petrolisthes cinctipes]|uniref:Uncharacterized protein n=1 Tax=Petrolisthes cinctipes TaxID=88211 RepID=A0AAE1KFX3_PETCI|nr:hypothetical protein Pcinc_020792 [Petrolisthes cinctipes]
MMMSSLVEALQVSPARSRRRRPPAAAHSLYRGVVRSKLPAYPSTPPHPDGLQVANGNRNFKRNPVRGSGD